jgi:hypothetical protein
MTRTLFTAGMLLVATAASPAVADYGDRDYRDRGRHSDRFERDRDHGRVSYREVQRLRADYLREKERVLCAVRETRRYRSIASDLRFVQRELRNVSYCDSYRLRQLNREVRDLRRDLDRLETDAIRRDRCLNDALARFEAAQREYQYASHRPRGRYRY